MQLSPTIDQIKRALGGIDVDLSHVATDSLGRPLVWVNPAVFREVLAGQVPELELPDIVRPHYYHGRIVRDGVVIKCQYWQSIDRSGKGQ